MDSELAMGIGINELLTMNSDGNEVSTVQSGSASLANPLAARPGLPGESRKFHLGYQPALDGLRGIAILAVVATHAKVVSGWAGDIGVDIFFVLSGFLITSLLIEESDTFHAISLKRFYARRALRLLPALVVLIVATVTWHCLANERVAARTAMDGLIALFYSSNWMFALGFRQPAHVFAHTWTLSIEEQFYLWWPLVLMFLLRRCSSRASLLRLVILGMFLLLVEKVLIVAGMTIGASNWLSYATDARADTLLMGCVAAIALCSKRIPPDGKLSRALKYSAWLVGIPGLVLVNIPFVFSADFFSIGLHITIAFFAVLILVEVVISERGMLGRLLSPRWLVYIGKVSYGLYLWHYPIFAEVQARHLPLLKELVIELALTMFATTVSFYLIERPALRLKSRFSSRRSVPQETVKGSPATANAR